MCQQAIQAEMTNISLVLWSHDLAGSLSLSDTLLPRFGIADPISALHFKKNKGI